MRRPTWCDADQFKLNSSIGQPLPDVEIKIVDEEGKTVSPFEVGEIWARGPRIMTGYWRDEQKTSQVMTLDGWLRTGDMGYLDEDGYLYLKGRKDFIIKTGGFLVSPIEVENAILKHSAVKETAVMGVPDERWHEAIKAIVCLKKGCSVTEEELKKHCRQYLAGFQIPKSVLFVQNLPRDEAGRVQLKELKKLLGSSS